MTGSTPIVLIAAADDSLARVVRVALQTAYRVYSANSAETLLQVLASREVTPDLLVLAATELRVDELVRRLRATPATANVPVLQLGIAPTEDGDRLLADGLLELPLRPVELRSSVRTLLRLGKFGEPAVESITSLPHTASAAAGSVRDLAASNFAATSGDPAEHERELLQTIIDRVPVMLTLYEPDTKVVRLNQAFERLVGWGLSEATGASLMEACYPDPEYRAQVTAFMQGCGEAWMDVRMRTRDGRDLETSWANIRLSDGSQVGIGIDLTARREAESALRRSESRLQAAVQLAELGVWEYDLARQLTHWDRRCLELFGRPDERPYTDDEVFGLIHPDDRARVAGDVAAALDPSGRRQYESEYRIVLPDGSIRWLAVRGNAIPAASEGTVERFVGTVMDITHRKMAEDALRSSETSARLRAEEIETILDAVPAAVWVARDPECQFVTGSRFSYEMLRLPPGANQSKSAPEAERPRNFRLYHPDGREFAPEELPLQKAAATGEPQRGVREDLVFEDGTRRTIYGNAEPLFESDGRPRGAVGAFVDITELAAAQEALAAANRDNERARAELEIADRRKNEFLAMLAHELRNPLAPIVNATALLRGLGEGDPVVDRQRAIIERNAHHLSRLVDDLLEVSRITRDLIELRLEPTELTQIVAQAVVSVQPRLESRHQELRIDASLEEIWLDADPTRLVQILVNLLNNASKYSPGHGTLFLSYEREGSWVRLSVRDHGKGIEPALLPHVFELFVQGESSLARTEGGLGIGLTLVKRLVELHGGTVTAASDGPGHGSVFTVRLPLRDRPVPVTFAQQGTTLNVPLGRRILLVEDNRDAAETLAELLTLWGHEVRVAHHGRAALLAAASSQPEIALIDLGLPGMDGYEVAASLRALPGSGGMVLLALTCYGQDDDRRRTVAAGFHEHLTKPVDPERLRALLAALPGPSVKGS